MFVDLSTVSLVWPEFILILIATWIYLGGTHVAGPHDVDLDGDRHVPGGVPADAPEREHAVAGSVARARGGQRSADHRLSGAGESVRLPAGRPVDRRSWPRVPAANGWRPKCWGRS